MKTDNIITQLKERGSIAQITDEQGLLKRITKGPIVLYCGFDPTADSLHLGHLIPLLCLKTFQNAGHKPIALIGGGTGLIGDPSLKNRSRIINSFKNVAEWKEKIVGQLTKFLDFQGGENKAIIVDNYDWFSNMNLLNFLRRVGKHFSINQLINKESVKQRFKRNDLGISFTEFSYNLLQSYDFSCLNVQYGVELQIGGSDQWGNITSGIDLTRRLQQQQVFGLTLPLITKSDGVKFGKTEDQTIWLDDKKTSPYKFYQFWINTADVDVYRFLKLFTFIDLKTIDTLEQECKSSQEVRRAQFILAEHATKLVHGNKGFSAAKRITQSLFSGLLNELKESDFQQLVQDGISAIELSVSTGLAQALVNANLVSSRRQSRALIEYGAISVNGSLQYNYKYQFSNSDRLYGRYTLIRKGKKTYCLICWQP
ncbi:MAG: tyrosine--tRNA ligase [Candidatus Dasytiphilus stammeri]